MAADGTVAVMGIRDIARVAELYLDYNRLQHGDKEAAGRLVRKGLPVLGDALLGNGGGSITTAALQLAERQGWIAPDNVIEGQFRVVNGDPGACHACDGRYSSTVARELFGYLRHLDSGVVVILGRPGTGKTMLSCALAEGWGRSTYCIGIPAKVLPFPTWQELPLGKGVLDLVPEDSAVIIDDALQFFNARANRAPRLLENEATLNRELDDLIQIVRHRRLLVAANMQTTRGLETGLLVGCKALAFKPPSVAWQLLERPDSHRLWAPALAAFEGMSESAIHRHVFVMTDHAMGLCHVGARDWYTDAISRNKAS